MTNPTPPPTAEPRPDRNDILDLGRLRRDVADRRIAGVAAGLARHLDIDPIIVRVTLVVLALFGGAGLLVYVAGWLLVPDEGSSDQPLGLDDHNRNLALLGVAILAALAFVSDVAGAYSFPWPLVIIGLVVVWFLSRRERAPRSYYQPGAGEFAATTAPTAYATDTATAQPHPASASAAAQAPYSSYPLYPQQMPVRPRNPRKRGPRLFWFTVALIATAIGTLGIIDVAGTSVPDPAYPALGLALTGAMLIVGAFWGRAGGLIFLGLVMGAATLAATATNSYDNKSDTYTPLTSAQVRDSYVIDGGNLLVDLSDVEDVEGLDGREIDVAADVGEITVIVPAGVDITTEATTDVGEIHAFGRVDSGFDVAQTSSLDGGDTAPDLKIIISLGIGQVTVREQ